MNRLSKAFNKWMEKYVDHIMGHSPLEQEENTADGVLYETPGMNQAIREAGEEGIVLLKNQGMLPFKNTDTVAVFGRCQIDTFYVGYGSGGDVHPTHTISLMAGLDNAGVHIYKPLAKAYDTWCHKDANVPLHGWWGHWPYNYEEMPVSDKIIKEAAGAADKALIILGRAAGEDRENKLEPGSFYLTQEEKKLLSKVTSSFKETAVLLNIGNIIDLSWIEDYPVNALVLGWQLGQETGDAYADVLTGKVNPSGKLPATIARHYEDYPSSGNFGGKDYNCYEEDIFMGYRYFETFAKDKVLYPFGFGLSYTSFNMECAGFSMPQTISFDEEAELKIKVTNTGILSGKEVAEVYINAPSGKLGKAEKTLVGFSKTQLLAPGEAIELSVHIPISVFSSFDDSGETGFPSSYVLEEGTYSILLGSSVRETEKAAGFTLKETVRLKAVSTAIPLDKNSTLQVLRNRNGKPVREAAPVNQRDLKGRILYSLPEEIPFTGDKGILLSDVAEGRHSMDEFIAQLSDEDLESLTHGEGGMDSSLGTPGNAGAFGGVNDSLRKKGIPPLITSDGPAGIRLRKHTALLPCGTALAASFNRDLIGALYTLEGQEAVHFGVNVLLGPGLNLHRNPLCGRNFEYYSEDPVLSGSIAASAVIGIQKSNVSACPKHFACNNQEFNRKDNDSRVSERALRELYLRNFEICIKNSHPRHIMTSYNRINGVFSYHNYDLATTILRKEWEYTGNILTDWWTVSDKSPDFQGISDNAYRTRAGVTVLMPGGVDRNDKIQHNDADQLASLSAPEGLTRSELQRAAKDVLTFAMRFV